MIFRFGHQVGTERVSQTDGIILAQLDVRNKPRNRQIRALVQHVGPQLAVQKLHPGHSIVAVVMLGRLVIPPIFRLEEKILKVSIDRSMRTEDRFLCSRRGRRSKLICSSVPCKAESKPFERCLQPDLRSDDVFAAGGGNHADLFLKVGPLAGIQIGFQTPVTSQSEGLIKADPVDGFARKRPVSIDHEGSAIEREDRSNVQGLIVDSQWNRKFPDFERCGIEKLFLIENPVELHVGYLILESAQTETRMAELEHKG